MTAARQVTTRPDGTVLPAWLRPGCTVLVSREASPQFAGSNAAFRFTLMAIDPKPTYQGWIWTVGYKLDNAGHAVERRELFVKVGGLRPVPAGEIVATVRR